MATDKDASKLSNHDGGNIRICIDYNWHYRGVNHSQTPCLEQPFNNKSKNQLKDTSRNTIST
jgi:hypothetical protein